jgi:hypothetical protein
MRRAPTPRISCPSSFHPPFPGTGTTPGHTHRLPEEDGGSHQLLASSSSRPRRSALPGHPLR